MTTSQKVNNKWIYIAATTVVATLLLSFVIQAAITSEADENTIEIGVQVGPASTLLFVAQDMGFFEQEGLEVELVEFTAGKFALQAFLGGSIDLAASGEVPVMYASLQGHEFYVISQVVEKTINEVRIVAQRKDEIDNPEEYFNSEKRTLATSFGGGPEFFTYNFLKKYNISEVELVNQKPEDMPVALKSGSVDAIAIFEPFAHFAEQHMGSDGITFSDNELYSELYVLNAHIDWVEQNPNEAKKILSALQKSSEFIESNPGESKRILQKYSKLNMHTIDAIWENFVYKPALKELLLDYLNDESQWAIETRKVDPETEIPNFKNYIYTDALRQVHPGAVSI